MKILQFLTLLFLLLTPFIAACNAYWCWANRFCNGESIHVNRQAKLWLSIAATLWIWIASGILDPDHRIHKPVGIICGFTGSAIIFIASCRFLASYLSSDRFGKKGGV